jgi:hypothetical protein
MIHYSKVHFSVSYLKKGNKDWYCNNYRCQDLITNGTPVVWADKHNTQFPHPATYCYHPACVPAPIRIEMMKNKYYTASLGCSDLLSFLAKFSFGEIQNDIPGARCLVCTVPFAVGEFIFNWKDCGSTHKNCYIGNKPSSLPLKKLEPVVTINSMPKPIPFPKPVPKHTPDAPTFDLGFFGDDCEVWEEPWEKAHTEYLNLRTELTFSQYLEQKGIAR